jgi:hypothetical protein
MWKDKETYFVIIEAEMFNMPVPIEISKALGYGDTVKYFGEIVWIARELEDSRWACSVQLIPYYKLPVEGVRDWISEADYQKACDSFGEANLITESEFRNLNLKVYETIN